LTANVVGDLVDVALIGTGRITGATSLVGTAERGGGGGGC
jgi:hypothetical protein